MKNYDTLDIILTLKKHLKLFIFLLIIFLAIGYLFANNQIANIHKMQNQHNATFTINKQYFASLLKIKKYNEILEIPSSIIDNVLRAIKDNGMIYDFRVVVKTAGFDIYAIYTNKELSKDSKQNIIKLLEDDPIVTETKQYISTLSTQVNKRAKDVLAMEFISSQVSYIQPNFNKHYIDLRKDRLEQNAYNVRSTQIIQEHTLLNPKKLYIFMILCSVIMSLFVVFFVESMMRLKAQLKNKKTK